MKAIAFVVLMFITVGAVAGAAWIGERWFAPGLERGIVMAVIAGFVVFPIARWFESRGWISGSWRLSKDPADNPPPGSSASPSNPQANDSQANDPQVKASKTEGDDAPSKEQKMNSRGEPR